MVANQTRSKSASIQKNSAGLSKTNGHSRMSTMGAKSLAMAKRGAQATAKATTAFAKEHPGVAATALVGIGLAAGALTQQAMRREPTLGEVLKDTLSRSAKRASKAIGTATRQGVKTATKRISKATR